MKPQSGHQSFLTEVLGVDEQVSEEDACKMEHLISCEISETNSLIVQLASGSQVVNAPVSIKTNLSGRAKITLPIDVSKFSSKDDLEKYISSLAVVVQHSDGKNVVDKGTIEYDSMEIK